MHTESLSTSAIMSRLLSLAVFAVLVGGLLCLPQPYPIRLAATQAGTLLREPAVLVKEGGAQAEATQEGAHAPALWEELLQSSVAHEAEDGGVELWVRGYRMDLSETPYRDHRLHARLFESVKRSLRSVAAEEGFSLSFKENSKKGFPGAVFWCSPGAGTLLFEAQLPEGTALRSQREWHAPGRLSVLPFLAAIFVALVLRRPLVALGTGVLSAALLERVIAGHGWLAASGAGAGRLLGHYLPTELFEPNRIEIILFIAFMLAMVGVITCGGGVRGLMQGLARWAKNARRSQIVTFAMGLVVFFDHYANAVLVGGTMRPLTDRFRIAREKLAYLVDSTAAPVAGLSIFSTWIAFEVSTFSIQLPDVGLAASQGYEVFLRTLPFRFYSLLTLFLVFLVVVSGRDLGPMARAEARARGGEVLRKGSILSVFASEANLRVAPGVTSRARTALWPLAAMVVTTLVTVLVGGGLFESEARSGNVIFAGMGTRPLMLGALVGFLVAGLQAWSVGLGRGLLGAAWRGVRSALTPLALLACAWLIGAICYEMGTTAYLTVVLQETFNPLLLPILLFLLAGCLSLGTGSSWATMTILLPLVVGLAYEAGVSTALGGEGMLVICIASVLEGAIFGDHCSPISHTTVMSSIAASCDHVDHVKTQAPYALLAMVVTTVCGYYPAVIFELSPVLSLLLGAGVLSGVFFFYGKKGESAQKERSQGPMASPPELGQAA